MHRHSPRGECGLKFSSFICFIFLPASLPARGVWIEIGPTDSLFWFRLRHSPRGECGLKYVTKYTDDSLKLRHSPRGECGLKLLFASAAILILDTSLPARGVWIEIGLVFLIYRSKSCHSPRGECGLKLSKVLMNTTKILSHSPRGECGLKLIDVDLVNNTLQSLPARGVWIEILMHTSG